MLARRNRRLDAITKYATKRNELKKVIKESADFEERAAAVLKLQKLPRNSSPSRLYRRCAQCGRPRAVYRKFALCRLCLRQSLVRGDVPGGVMASW